MTLLPRFAILLILTCVTASAAAEATECPEIVGAAPKWSVEIGPWLVRTSPVAIHNRPSVFAEIVSEGPIRFDGRDSYPATLYVGCQDCRAIVLMQFVDSDIAESFGQATVAYTIDGSPPVARTFWQPGNRDAVFWADEEAFVFIGQLERGRRLTFSGADPRRGHFRADFAIEAFPEVLATLTQVCQW